MILDSIPPPSPSIFYLYEARCDLAVKLVGSWAVRYHHAGTFSPVTESTTAPWACLRASTLGRAAGWCLCARDCSDS